MALKITKAADPITVDRINLVVYAPPGVGKTSLAFTAEAPLLLDFDSGAHRAPNRKDVVRVNSWLDVTDITPDDLAPYRTLIVDTAGRGLDALTVDIIRRNAKLGRGGVLNLQGYGALKGEFIAWLKSVNAAGIDVVLIAHMDEQRNGDDIIERLDVQGGSKNEIYKAADAMARLNIVGKERVLNFSPTDTAFGKNPAGLDPIPVPHPDKAPDTLAKVIVTIKEALNRQTAEAAEAQRELEAWREGFALLETAEQFNETVEQIAQQPPKVKALLLAAAAERGIVFDKRAKRFVAPQQAAA